MTKQKQTTLDRKQLSEQSSTKIMLCCSVFDGFFVDIRVSVCSWYELALWRSSGVQHIDTQPVEVPVYIYFFF